MTASSRKVVGVVGRRAPLMELFDGYGRTVGWILVYYLFRVETSWRVKLARIAAGDLLASFSFVVQSDA
jgi:hypothetical protein